MSKGRSKFRVFLIMLSIFTAFAAFLKLHETFFSSHCNQNPALVTAAARDTLRILDINVWSGLDYVGYWQVGEYETPGVREKRYRALVRQIKRLKPDVIGVHEANMLPVYAERLACDLGYDVYYHTGVGGVRMGPLGLPRNLREGDAILAKRDLRMEPLGREQLSGGYAGNFFTFHFEDATQILAVRLINHGKPFYIFATHWHASLLETLTFFRKVQEFKERGSFNEEEYHTVRSKIREGAEWRMAEAQKTAEFIRKTAGSYPYILMGDFNATASAPEIKHLLQAGMVDAFRETNPTSAGYTWDPETNLNVIKYYMKNEPEFMETASLYDKLNYFQRATPKRVDYIFLRSRGFRLSAVSSRVVINEVVEGVHASDHYGVFVKVAFRR